VIASFKDGDAEDLFRERRASKRLRPYARVALRKLQILDAATRIDELAVPPGNQLKKVSGTRDVWQIRIDQQYRIRFRWDGADARDVEVGDFHE